jgi:hypothetical protein
VIAYHLLKRKENYIDWASTTSTRRTPILSADLTALPQSA